VVGRIAFSRFSAIAAVAGTVSIHRGEPYVADRGGSAPNRELRLSLFSLLVPQCENIHSPWTLSTMDVEGLRYCFTAPVVNLGATRAAT
jgi:hypothetical protein